MTTAEQVVCFVADLLARGVRLSRQPNDRVYVDLGAGGMVDACELEAIRTHRAVILRIIDAMAESEGDARPVFAGRFMEGGLAWN